MASLKVLLYTSKTLSNGEHPIMLRVISNRKPQYVNVGFNCSKANWDFENNLPKKKHPNFRRLCLTISEKIRETNNVILELENESEEVTTNDVLKKVKNDSLKTSFYAYAEKRIKEEKEKGSIKNSLVYADCLRVIKLFTEKKDFNFRNLDLDFLKKFETYLMKTKIQASSISVYLRTLRALQNKAIKEGYCKLAWYRFKEFEMTKYNNVKTKKRAITPEDVLKIEEIQAQENSQLFHSRNYFIFSYYTGGTNFTDIATLTWDKNILSDFLEYNRKKTKKDLTINLHAKALKILEYYKDHQFVKTKENYVFPILNDLHVTEQQKHNRIVKILKATNKDLKTLASLANIDELITFYVARHSFATALKRKGVKTSMISEIMGHDSETTTQIYLDSFENAEIKSAMDLL